MRNRRTAIWNRGRRPARSSFSLSQEPTSRLEGSLLDAEDALGLAEGSHRLVVLAVLVKLLAVGAQLLHFGGLLGVELRLGQRRVDRLHLVGAVVCECRGCPQQKSDDGSESLHEPLPV